ncbi:hypothetical protein FMUBM48_22420 [Nocardia cyriacigeorgica]|nr:hypothetical protein FMUBM48_22420 [Nocardia cyriacigeorgica]
MRTASADDDRDLTNTIGSSPAHHSIEPMALADQANKVIGPGGTGIMALPPGLAEEKSEDMDNTTPQIAILYATDQGSTRDIAEFIADDLTGRGARVALHDIEHAPDLSRFEAVVIGSAIHDMDLLPAASAYIRAHSDELSAARVWLFSVGLGPALRGPVGRRLGRIVPKKIAELRDMISPVEYQAFAGRYERAGVGWKARTIYRLMGGARYGDLRDWVAIRTWSDHVARAVGLPRTATNTVHP